ncbi:MAG: hypothetical protein JJ969_01305 [Rhizobiaceae bacterium]|nr:hypothetical protein [Rhizobiaceae bacterium]
MDRTTKELRMTLLENGYTPLPNLDKRCMLPKWPTVEVTPELINTWDRRNKRFDATGLRVQDGLAVIDFDIDHDEETMDAIVEEIEKIPGLEELSQTALIRFGKGTKEAWFVQTDETFSRIHSRNWVAPGDSEDDATHMVECFGGLSPRQFGAFGAHSRGPDGTVLRNYTWDGPSPADTPKRQLPTLTKKQFSKLVDTVSETLKARGFTAVERSTSGENDTVRVYDLTEDMVFNMADGRRLTLAELRIAATGGREELRCSASWFQPGAQNRTRCLVGTTKKENLFVWESAACQTHMEKSLEPCDLDLDKVSAELSKLQDRSNESFRNVLLPASSLSDGGVTLGVHQVAAQLIRDYALCPSQPSACCVPIESRDPNAGVSLQMFKVQFRPYAEYGEVGPRGGKPSLVHPVDLWLASKDKVIVGGLRTRPDKPCPTFSEDGATFINTYRRPEFDCTGGDTSLGLEFLEHLVPNREERTWFLQWLSFKYQNPHIPGPAIVMVAHQKFGTGRGTLFKLLEHLLDYRYVRHLSFDTFTGKTYQSQYNEFLANAVLVCVDESSESTDASLFRTKRNTYEHLKELVDPSPKRREIRVKGRDNYWALSPTSFIIATNHLDALPLPDNDRRFAVLENGGTNDEAYWKRVHEWIDNPSNCAAFAHHLSSIELIGYSPYSPPPSFRAKTRMADAAKSDIDRAFELAVKLMPSPVMTVDQLAAAMRRARDEDDLRFPPRWDGLVKRLAERNLFRVGEIRGRNSLPQIKGKRAPAFARTQSDADNFTSGPAKVLRDSLQANDQVDKSERSIHPGRRLAQLMTARGASQQQLMQTRNSTSH